MAGGRIIMLIILRINYNIVSKIFIKIPGTCCGSRRCEYVIIYRVCVTVVISLAAAAYHKRPICKNIIALLNET